MLEIYYDESSDSVQLVENGKVKYHEDGAHGNDFFNYFDVLDIDEMSQLSKEEILRGYACMLTDYKYNAGEVEVAEYLHQCENTEVQGKLMFTIEE